MPFVKNTLALSNICIPKPPQIKYGKIWEKFDISNPKSFKIRLSIAYNIARAIHELHKTNNYVLVDLKPDNIRINNSGHISIIDLDSIQITRNSGVPHYAEVCTPEYSPPEYFNNKINPQQTLIAQNWDIFSFGVLTYQLLFTIHPYQGSHYKYNTLPELIQNGLFANGRYSKHFKTIPPFHKDFNNLSSELKSLYFQCFDDGHINPTSRPKLSVWINSFVKEINNSKSKNNLAKSRIPYNKRGQRSSNRPKVYNTYTQQRTNTYQPQARQTATRNQSNKTLRNIIIGLVGIIFISYLGSNLFSGSSNRSKTTVPARTTYTNNNAINRTGYISANQYANIRSGNSTSSKVISSKNRGESVYVLEKDPYTRWYKVRYGNNKYGYISNKLISFSPIPKSQPKKTITVTNSNSIISSKKLRNYPNTFRGVVGILNYGVQVDNDLNNLFRKEFGVSVNDETLKRFGFQQLNKSSKFKHQYVNKPLTQKEIYEYLDIQKSISYLKSTATPEQLSTYNNGNSQNAKAPQNITNTSSLKNSLIGNWQIINESSSYSFNSNGRGYYINSRNRRFDFNWSAIGSNLKITLDHDRSIWNWRIQSSSGNQIKMYSSQHNQNRTIRKK